MANAGPVLFEPLHEALVTTRAWISSGLRVVPAELGGEAGLIGAAALLRRPTSREQT